jgi:hypothetical protein
MTSHPRDLARIAELERKVDHLYRHLGIEPPPPDTEVSPRVRALAMEGKVLEAIQAYRSESGTGLAEAKGKIDAIIGG